MSALVEIGDRISNTQALIARYEAAMVERGAEPSRSIAINIRSLEKLKRKLEADYLAVADQLELEVYKYRILNDSERVTLPGVAEAWAKFHNFFGAVYNALTEADKATKKPVSSERLQLGYGYSFASSVGVVVTVPKEVGIFAASPIEEASIAVFDLIEAKRVPEIARELGPEPIRALHEWIGIHIKHHYGLGLSWHADGHTKRSTEVQYQSLNALQTTIGETTTRDGLDIKGKLYAVNEKTKEFRLIGDNGTEFHGQFGEAITVDHAASVPARYTARIVQVTKIIAIGKEPEITYFLERLDTI